VLPEHASELAAIEKRLREKNNQLAQQEREQMITETDRWTTAGLMAALTKTSLVIDGHATTDLIDGIDQALHIVMKDFGDLPVFLTISGEQIIVESVLWSVDEVADLNRFNDAVLRTHKYFPLSTISLDNMGENGDYYHMFGALSARSLLENIVFEIEVLASNVIQATEAYSEYLTTTADTNKH